MHLKLLALQECDYGQRRPCLFLAVHTMTRRNQNRRPLHTISYRATQTPAVSDSVTGACFFIGHGQAFGLSANGVP